MTPTPHLIDSVTGEAVADQTAWQSPAGHPLDIANLPPFDPDAINEDDWSLWRYGAMLPVTPSVRLGAGMTPLVESSLGGHPFHAKLDYLNPTGSYKDRGTTVMLNHLLAQGVTQVVEDSSGNAGSSLALYAGAADVAARIFTPSGAPAGKKRQIALAAEIVEVGGSRADVTTACIEASNAPGTVYASHAWSPFFIAGQMTLAWELWEQLGRRAPGAVACPVGMGGLLLGIYDGFVALQRAGLIDRLPRLFAVQAAACDPVVRGWEQGLTEPVPVTPQPTLADGIVIGRPVRGAAIMRALQATNGSAFRVEEADIAPTRAALAKRGLFVEPTSATTAAALPQIHAGYDGEVVVVLTGHGLKVG